MRYRAYFTILFVVFYCFSGFLARCTPIETAHPIMAAPQCIPSAVVLVNDSPSIFEDDFISSPTGFNTSLWTLESYGEGSTSWIEGEQFKMTAKRHSFRTLVSRRTFAVGHVVNIRMKLNEDETSLCVGWTNDTASTGWNYLFGSNSVLLEGALSSMLLQARHNDSSKETVLLPGVDTSVFHDYRLVWNSSVLVAYVDGDRLGVIGSKMPEGPYHLKIALTEVRNMTTEGSVVIDRVSISHHQSMRSENPPFLVLSSPGNNTPNLFSDKVNIAAVGSDGTLFYNWDGADNSTATSPAALDMPPSEGLHELRVYCRDGFGYDNWASERYVFRMLSEPPEIEIPAFGAQPAVDGVRSPDEWPEDVCRHIDLYWRDGRVQDVPVYIAHNGQYVYFGVDSPVPSGHDSRAAVVLTGELGDRFVGSNTSPVMSVIYNKGSPSAWGGYDELCYLNESADGDCPWRKLEPQPTGFAYASDETETGVWYEFRLPLDEFDSRPGDYVGLAVALFPSGMSVHHMSYPLLDSWNDISRLARAYLAPIVTSPLPVVVPLALLATASIVYVLWRRHRAAPVPVLDESERRILEIVRSYDEISLDRLAQMTNLDSLSTRKAVSGLIESGELKAVLSEDATTVKRV
ncbi:hypothetical protein EU546_04995 [Candidatus Thorarchaeota archaeon]|nr:MAG: hypothetical protein EU546_04995 [Candidatus Thorarchaeota archaeon]